MIRIGICDDESRAREALKIQLEQLLREEDAKVIYEFSSGEGLCAWLPKHAGELDLLFLDVEMGGMNGMETARRIRQSDNGLLIVFVTGYADFVFDGYSVQALDYVMKPVKRERLAQLMERVEEQLRRRSPQTLTIQNTEGLFRVAYEDILYCYSDRRQVTVVTQGREYPFYAKLDDVASYVVTKSQSFNSANKFSQAYIAGAGRTFYKGAPEKFLAVARKYISLDGDERPLNLDALNAKIDELAGKSMRVLAFGYSPSEMTENAINPDTVLIGLVGIRDDVRPEAQEAIAEVQKAGIQVVMITGDRLETAVAIARDANLLRGNEDIALTSAQLNELSDDEVKKIIPRIRVIARALPTDKSRMVRLCQELNLVVGMTGDGVNDSPALKRADVGFAMGSGTEAAKEAGKIVILDDNFRSIKDAIWYGRTIYHNILKFCKFQLVINVAAVVVSAIAPFFGVEEPLKVTHLLFVNLVMDGLGAIMLGNEPAQERYMSEPPRRRDESIVSKSMMAQIVTMGLWLTALSFIFLKAPFFDTFFASTEQKLSAYFVLFIWSALFNAFNVRSDSFDIFKDLKLNPGFMQVFVIIVLVQAFIVNAALVPVPVFAWISNMFSCVPFPPAGWGVAILLAFTMIPVDILRKVVVGRK